MKFLLHQLTAAALCLSFAAAALADGEPNVSFHQLIGRYIQEARSNYGATNGLLASDLLLLISNDLGSVVETKDRPALIGNIKELLDVYPKMPSENQRYLAARALDLGYRLIDGKSPDDDRLSRIRQSRCLITSGATDQPEANKPQPFTEPTFGSEMIAHVVEAAAKNHWPSNPALNKRLERVAADQNINQTIRARAEEALKSQAVSQAFKVEPAIAEMEGIMKADWPPENKSEKPLNWAGYRQSWLKEEPEQAKNTPPEKRQAKPSETIITYTFPEPQSQKIANDLDILIKLYPSLPEADQYSLCARIMELNSRLHWTNLQNQSDTLFWEVFASVKVGWLDTGQISGGLLSNHSCYFQPNSLPNAKKIMVKVVEFESAGNPNFASDLNRRTVLGDVCDKMGDRTEAKKQYELVKNLNEKMYSDGFSSPDFHTQNQAAMEERLKAYR